VAIRCSNCDHPNDEGALFCANCNHYLAWSGADTATGTEADREPEEDRAVSAPTTGSPAVRDDDAGPSVGAATPATDLTPSVDLPPAAPVHAPEPAAPMQEFMTALETSSNLAEGKARTDLTDRLDGVKKLVEQRTFTVAVVGEFKRGKSTLVNALLQTAVCPVDADIVTGVPTLVRYGESLKVLAHAQPPGDEGVTTESLRLEDLPSVVAEGADGRAELRSVEVQVRHRLLRHGLCLLDTPGVGGLDSVHGQLSLASLTAAVGLLFVTDASQELTAPELEYLTVAVARCPRAALVVTKVDLHQHWRTIVEANRRHLLDAGLELPVIPVSSFLRLRAARRPALNEESGFEQLVGFLADVVRRTTASEAGAVAHEVDFVATQLARQSDAERVVLARPEDSAAVLDRLGEAHTRARSLSAPTAGWQQVLNDGIQDLVSDAEYDLAARLRTVLRDVKDVIEESDPKETWEDTQAWLRRQVAEAGVANRDLVVRRANELSDAVAERFNFESGAGVELELEAVSRTLADLEIPSAATFAMPGGRLVSVLSSGRLAAYVPLMALSLALHTSLLIVPPAALVGVLLGRVLFRMEGKKQRSYRQGQARAAAAKFIDEVAFEMNKDARDGLRRTQRRLRDEFQSRAGSIQASAGAALEAASRASRLDAAARVARAAELDEETRQLGDIRGRMRALASPVARGAPELFGARVERAVDG
jgi:hypothetical protein